MQNTTTNPKDSARAFFEEHKAKKEKAREAVVQKTENDRKILTTLNAGSKPVNMNVWIWKSITNVVEETMRNLLKNPLSQPVQFNFNGVKMLVHPSEIAQELEENEDVNEVINKYICNKNKEYFDNLRADNTLNKTATQAYLQKKKEKKANEQEKQRVTEIKEKEKTLPTLAFGEKQYQDVSKLAEKRPELLEKYHIEPDENGKAEVDAETIRNIGLDINQDGYSRAVYTYAERRAKFMQVEIAQGKNVEEIASELSHYVDIEGVTGFMYGAAVSVLSQTWKYGEELRKRHNKKHNHEWDWVVNPAVITIG